MRVESNVTSLSWIPYDAISGHMKLPFALKMTHWDEVPPDHVDSREELEALRDADRFRFANVLSAWAEFDDDGHVVAWGRSGGGVVGSTTVKVGKGSLRFAATGFEDLVPDPEITRGSITFLQTAGGRTGAPMPRTVSRPPYVQLVAPTAWTTLRLTLHADGTSTFDVVGASPFPRHWVYGPDGAVALKTGFIDFKTWAGEDFGTHSPWGGQDREVRSVAVESEIERELSVAIMAAGQKPDLRRLPADAVLLEQGTRGEEVFLLLDGMVTVEVDGQPVAQVGPGAILGEGATVEGQGVRGATVRAATPIRVVAALPDQLDLGALAELAARRRAAAAPQDDLAVDLNGELSVATADETGTRPEAELTTT